LKGVRLFSWGIESLPGRFFSDSIYIMEVEINPRGNGACPLCNSNGSCRIQDTLTKEMKTFSSKNDPMELVVYSCPQFQEKV
jgi:hypothetical protein